MMFKKYAKNLLDREINGDAHSDDSHYDYTPFQEESGDTSSLHTQPTYYRPDENEHHQEEAHTPNVNLDKPEMVIGENVSIKGDLVFDKLVKVDGTFEGNLLSDGKLVIGPKGKVVADICLEEAFVSGKVKGNIEVRDRLVLRGHAEIEGNIKARRISVDEGVVINGNIEIIRTQEAV